MNYSPECLIMRSSSPLHRKTDSSLRLSIQVMVKTGYPLSRIDESVRSAWWCVVGFSKIDLQSHYHQLQIREGDIQKNTFRICYDYYKFLVMPFWLTNEPATFMDLMNNVFWPYLDQFVIVFLDDVLIYSRSGQEHEAHLQTAFQTLRECCLFVKFFKHEFQLSKVFFPWICGIGSKHSNISS